MGCRGWACKWVFRCRLRFCSRYLNTIAQVTPIRIWVVHLRHCPARLASWDVHRCNLHNIDFCKQLGQHLAATLATVPFEFQESIQFCVDHLSSWRGMKSVRITKQAISFQLSVPYFVLKNFFMVFFLAINLQKIYFTEWLCFLVFVDFCPWFNWRGIFSLDRCYRVWKILFA